MSQLVGYVIGTQMKKTVKVRVPAEVYLPKYKKTVIKHKNYLAHDENGRCLVGDTVRIVPSIQFSRQKSYAVAGIVRQSDRFIDDQTGFVYTNGHLKIPVGYRAEDGSISNMIPTAKYRQMGLI